jgi:hypothetical protein
VGVVERTQDAYYWLVFLALLVSWSPNKILPYLVPFVSLLLIVFLSRSKTILRNILILGLGLAIWIGFYILLYPDLILQNALLSVITYSSLFLVIVIPTRYLASSRLYFKIAKILLIMIAIQSFIGAIQVTYGFSLRGSFDTNTGDHIEGTIDLALPQKPGLETPMFAINMAFSLIALLPYILVQKNIWSILIFLFGTVILVFSSVVHVLLLFLIAMMFSFFIYQPINLRSRRAWITAVFFVIMLLVIVLLMYKFIPSNLNKVPIQYERVIRQENPKTILLMRLLQEIPMEYPLLPFVGLGPGQFSSRASLIASGYYLGGLQNPQPPPFLQPVLSPALNRYVLDLWFGLRNWPGSAGSTLRPFSSWLSVYSEFGLIGCIGIVLLFFGILIHVKYQVRNNAEKIIAFSIGSGVGLLFLLGIQENYWEVPQAILVGCMTMKVLYAILISHKQLVSKSTIHYGN